MAENLKAVEVDKFLSKNNSYTLHKKSYKKFTIHIPLDIKVNKCKLS